MCAVVMRLPPFVYAKDFSYFYNVMYKAAKTKGAASYVDTGESLTTSCWSCHKAVQFVIKHVASWCMSA